MAEVSGGRVRGRPMLGWMDGVKVALGNRRMTVETARQCAKDQKEWRALVHMQLNEFHAAILLGPVFIRTALPCSPMLSQIHGEGRDAVTRCGWDKL